MNREIVYYQNDQVKITNARAVLGDKTYALSNITSVSLFKQEPNNTFALLVFLSGIVSALLGIVGDTSLSCLGIGVLLLIVGGAIMYNNKPKYIVKIGSASGEADVLPSTSKEYVQEIVDAVNHAIVEKGISE